MNLLKYILEPLRNLFNSTLKPFKRNSKEHSFAEKNILNIEQELEEFKYLYDGNNPHWVLLKATKVDRNSGEPVQIPGSWLIYNQNTKRVKIIENHFLQKEIVNRMLANNCLILK